MNLGPGELVIILLIVLLLFGATRLPRLARSMGQALKEFKKGADEGPQDEADEDVEKPGARDAQRPASPSAG
jgi:sec-independent protein translocase protein TatA